MGQAHIAMDIGSNIHRLTEKWIQDVRDDERITSDAELSKRELTDHVPAIIEEICELMKAGEQPGPKNTHEARASVYMRFRQGYRGRDLVRELSLLRLILFDHLTQIFANKSANLTIDDYAQAARVINLYIDEEMRYAISVYGGPNPPAQQ